MSIVITMAGRGQRFKEAGYSLPKPMITARGRTLFAWALESLRLFFDQHFVFISRTDSAPKEFIENECANIGISNFSILMLENETRGQAETAFFAKDKVDTKDELLIYNIDTHVTPKVLQPKTIRGNGWIPCFEAEGTHWSFVSIDQSGKALAIKEKERISTFATIGLYYFSSFDLFASAYKETNFDESMEHYVAPIYNILLNDKKHSVYTEIIPSSAVSPLGTPNELDYFKSINV